MERESESDNPDAQVEAPRENRWVRFVGYIKRKVNERKAKKQNETPTDKAARRTAVATIWMAIFTFVLASTSGFTIWILKNQLTEMHEGGIDTHVLAEAAEDGAGAASDQADAAQQFSDTAEDINGRMSDAVDQLQATADNTKTTIKATQDALRLEQRPWMFISGMDLKPLVLNDPLTVEYSIKNEGRTPATMRKDSKISMAISLAPVNQLKDIAANTPFKAGLAFPGVIYGPTLISSTTMTGGPPRLLGANELAAYNSKPPTLWVYIYGRLIYADTFLD